MSFDETLHAFLDIWPAERIDIMTIDEYCDLSDHNSFCYWLEYGSYNLGEIGDNPLTKFELWKPKEDKDFVRYFYDGRYAWNKQKGPTADAAFETIRKEIKQIIQFAQQGDLAQIDFVDFQLIPKWKIAFLYSDQKLLPIYSRRAIYAVALGLGIIFKRDTPLSELHRAILDKRQPNETMEHFAWNLYAQYARKGSKRNYYLIGSKYNDDEGRDVVPVIDDFLANGCVAMGFMGHIDFSPFMGAADEVINKVVDENYEDSGTDVKKRRRYFRLFSKIKEGDIIAVKSHGAFNSLTIIAYAEVVKVEGSVYSHHPDILGHHIHVTFLDSAFTRELGLNYAETLHQIIPEDDSERFFKIFSWYSSVPDSLDLAEAAAKVSNPTPSVNGHIRNDGYSEKTEQEFERSAMAAVKVKRMHNVIQNSFVRYLQSLYPSGVSGEKNWIDAKYEDANSITIFEIKPYENSYTCVRQGIGQLLDYYHRLQTAKRKRIVVVGPNKPSAADVAFVQDVKSNLAIPFSYLAFDYKTWEVSEY